MLRLQRTMGLGEYLENISYNARSEVVEEGEENKFVWDWVVGPPFYSFIPEITLRLVGVSCFFLNFPTSLHLSQAYPSLFLRHNYSPPPNFKAIAFKFDNLLSIVFSSLCNLEHFEGGATSRSLGAQSSVSGQATSNR